jgi:transcriptional regulator with XRE-family HTH domain
MDNGGKQSMVNAPNAAGMDNAPEWPERHELPKDVAELLKRARKGRSFRQAARDTGVDAGYICTLEHGRRAPSIVVAEALIEGYRMSPPDAERLRSASLHGVGRDSDPIRYERARDSRA